VKEEQKVKYVAIEPAVDYCDGDEIDLRELFKIIWKQRIKIVVLISLVLLLSFIYVLGKPNIYTSKTILIPKQQEKSSLTTASALASMAGISVPNDSSSINIPKLFDELLNDFYFNKNIILKHHLVERFSKKSIDKNLVFAFGFDGFYRLFSSTDEKKDKNARIFDIYKKIKNILSVSSDKNSNLITLKAKSEDRFLAKELLDIYLKEMSDYIKKMDLESIESQMKYYQNELSKVNDVELKANILDMISNLIKRKVLSQSGKFYMVKQLTEPKVAYIKDKTEPKRALILIVSFITSLIFGIFLVLFLEFLKGKKSEV